MKRTRRGMLSAVAALSLGMAGVAASAASAPSAYAAPCYGASCYGKDPYTLGCTESSTTSNRDSLVTVWNKYSILCNANWARAQLTSTAVNDHYWLYLVINTTGENTHVGPYNGTQVIWTDMVDGTDVTQACAKVFKDQAMTVMVDQVCASQ